MRVALFGGTFDPIHRGHLRLAAAAADTFALDRVLIAPVGHQPLKPDGPTASFADRLAMVALACNPNPSSSETASGPAPDPRLTPSDIDAPRPDGSPNYAIDTLTTLRRQLPEEALFVLAGADSFLSLPRWRSPEKLLDLAEWIVVSRPGSQLTPAFLDAGQPASLALTPAQRNRIHLLTTVHEEVSATELRRRLRMGDPCSGLLPDAVAAYIRIHNLYR